MFVPEFPSSNSVELEMEEEMSTLYQSLNSLLSGTQNKIIQFMSSSREEGTSTIVREFAMTVVSKYGRSVLLVDADLRKPSQFSFFNIKPEHCLEETIRKGEPVDKALYQIANSSLFLSQLCKGSDSTRQFIDPSGIDDLLEKLWQRFDFILIDSPPATSFSIGLTSSDSINGLVLVLEAEKTRWPVVKKMTDRINNNGGKILGVVFNKQRRYIPDFIYKRL